MKSICLLFCFLFFMGGISGAQIQMGADKIDEILKQTDGKRVGIIVNHTSLLSGSSVHLLDTLVARGVNIKKIFAPEHGFRGQAAAGEKVDDERDTKTGLPVISLYGKNRKPTPEQLSDIDMLIFDIQDVGTRFYTYISTMFYAMKACSEQHKEMLVLDRPNPNDYVDGPIVSDSLKSFVGAVSVPVLHGLTVGELACMIRGEKWDGVEDYPLHVIRMSGWKHGDPYSLPVRPSPNLPNDQAIKLYPSLCFFEATNISVGRGTEFPFQVLGYPDKKFGTFTFTPVAMKGFDNNPLQKNKLCYGLDLRQMEVEGGLSLKYLLDFLRIWGDESFISRVSFFDLLMGCKQTRYDILAGKTEAQIKQRWQPQLAAYKQMRKQYLLYPDDRNL